MRLSTKTRYGVRAVFDIAFHSAAQPGVAAQAKEIARREQIPLRYLEQIFQELKRAGLVDSKRGPHGGYFLKRDASTITLADVVRALEGPIEEMFLAEGEEAKDGNEPANSRELTCGLWRDLADNMGKWLESVTFAELVKRGEALGLKRSGADQPMYYI